MHHSFYQKKLTTQTYVGHDIGFGGIIGSGRGTDVLEAVFTISVTTSIRNTK